MGKEGERDEGDVATCAVVAIGAMHTVQAMYVSAAPVWQQCQYERFSCTANAVRPWIVEALGRSEDALASRRVMGPAEGQNDMAGGNATHTPKNTTTH